MSRDIAWDDPAWLRGDLCTAEHLEAHAVEIAKAQGAPSRDVTPGPLRARFTAAQARINDAYRILERGAPTKRELSPAEEWLLDNSHVVAEQLREIEEDLPAGYLAKLPRLSTGVMAGYPCVYGIALDYLRHTDARLDLGLLIRFVLAYQSVRSLTIGELWAVPIMLRLGLLLTVGALAASEANSKDRARADLWAAKILAPGQHASRMGEVLDELDHEGIAPTPLFLVQLLRRLREHDAPIGVAIDWIAVQSARLGLSPEELTRRQHLRQAADQVSVGNAITSMRTIGALDWNKFFENTSAVEAILQRDPVKAYGATDAQSRDRYRHAIEDIARRSTGDEHAIAELAIELAEAAHRRDAENVGRAHVGYYLIDVGRAELEARFGYRPRLRERLSRFVLRHPTACYLGSVGVLTTGLVAGAVATAKLRGSAGKGLLAALGTLSVIPASEVALTIVNGFVTALLPPRLLAKLDFPKGVPAEHRTLVAVPALLDGEAGIRRLLADLEIRSLANADENLHFALITDFTDHDREEHAEDEKLLALAREGIAELNRRRPGGKADRYLLLHRRRLHNPAQGVWMGWERKRGKLEELNHLLRGDAETTFTVVTASPELLRSFRYVITLDADTQLPRETARKLVATIAHPLNRPRIDPRTGRILEGYGVIQPRVGTEPVSARRSLFARIMAGPAGIDPYTTAVSDVYQDLFGEGSYVGKAIYDIEAFSLALDGRVPENRLLSHDLFEGIYARTALATDIELIDDQPASYSVVAGRQHRWIRGDWQLLAWLSTHVPVDGDGLRRSDLSIVARWKLLDNLRRSVVPPNLIALLLLGWLSGPAVAVVATATLGGVLVTPLFGWVVMGLTRSHRDGSPSRLSTLGGQVQTNLLQAGLKVVFLLDQAMIMVDAIGRTLHRLFVSREQLLEWTTTSEAERARAKGRSGLDRRMLFGSALALGAGALVGIAAPAALPLAAPLLLAWAAAPLVAQRLSRPLPARDRSSPLSAADRRELRLCARKTWYFFETFVTAEESWLPPDNFQEDPRAVVAHRTSPTNIGLYLLSIVAARDFGFVTLRDLTERLGATLTTIERLEKREGHVLNWYETTTLRPLDPRYVSTVDSGNLAAYLWTVRTACGEAADTPLIGASALDAAIDNLDLLAAELTASAGRGPSAAPRAELRTALTQARDRIGKDWGSTFAILRSLVASAARIAAESVDLRARPARYGVGSWAELTRRGLASWVDELRAVAPFAESLAEVPEVLSTGTLEAPFGELARGLSAAWTATTLVEATTLALTRLVPLEESLRGSQGVAEGAREAGLSFLAELRARLILSQGACSALQLELTRLGARAGAIADGMSFKFLYDEERALFSIGYNVGGARLDASYYDLLASEARLASLIAIAKGDLPQEHWFRLSRPRAELTSGSVLLSWSGSMFEYLMPLLVTRTYENTLLDETCDSVVSAQRAYGEKRDVPWGISESAYNTMDLSMTYQYRAFGVPGLGLKAGLADDLVVAPYATALASLIRPDLAAENLRALARDGLDGDFGYYEAIDYTSNRVPAGRRGVVVKAFMAHHQGMTLVALDNVLCGGPMQRRFHADPRIKACELLLEERVPVGTPFVELRAAVSAPAPSNADAELDVMEHVSLAAPGPLRAHLLGYGELSTLVTAVGTGFTTWRGLDINRFREDPVLEAGGIYLYLRDLSNGEVWSAGFQPTRRKPDHYSAAFSSARAEIHRRDGDLETVTEIGVSPEHPAEVRRVTVTNHGTTPREIELTSYTEVVLADRNADVAHRAFSGIFVETEALPERGALLARRIPRSSRESETWLVQILTSEDDDWHDFEFECSRSSFVGRGRTLAAPRAMMGSDPLSGTTGAVLDPALALRRRVLLQPGKRARIAICTVLAPTREAALELVDIYGAPPSIARTFELGWADARVELKHLGMTGVQAERAQRLLSAILFPVPQLRAGEGAGDVQGSTKDALWSQGISGDLPILLLRVDEPDFIELCRELLLAHEYWRVNGVAVDVVILNEEPSGYNQPLQEAILAQIASSPAQGQLDQRGGVFVRRQEQLSHDAQMLMLGAARVVLVASRGSLGRQLRSAAADERPLPVVQPPREALSRVELAATIPDPVLFGNGLGGFREDGREYIISTGPDARTPAPWCNVIANPSFGCVVSESGSMVTWSENSQSHRLTPWSNDPVTDPSGEAIYLRDDEDGSVWSATPAPAGGDRPYEIRHGQGYTLFRHSRGGLEHELCVFVDPIEPVKVCRLRLYNRGSERRMLSVCGTVEWVLGGSRERSRLTVVTAWDSERQALLAQNPFSGFPEHRAFFRATGHVSSFTADREEIFGRGGSRRRPAALDQVALSGRTGAGLDPGGALLAPTSIAPGESVEISFVLGEGKTLEHARELCAAFASPARVQASFDAALGAWNQLLGTVTVKTPNPDLDLLLNRWLLYQALSSRVWGRSAFYQSGGAYGFRDQLQDVLALLHAQPSLARAHILRAAERQFVEGDVQHWWHAETGEGVRTRCSDDLLWLPYVTAEYVRATGDAGILDEVCSFLDQRRLKDDEHDVFAVPARSAQSGSLYEHCTRALDAGTTSGAHGLPLMRAGDWNDGMNRIGEGGVGESVWLAWFLARTLRDFTPLALAKGDDARVARCTEEIRRLTAAIEDGGWDGEWYRRAYFDDGTPVGSRESAECTIDAIAQSWAVIAGVGDPARAVRANQQAEKLLLREDDGIMLLFSPPFTGAGNDPGYIRAYPAGVRENGGQYTHGVLWSALAMALAGDGDRAVALLSMLAPINHASTPEKMLRYAVEPYVVAADVYAAPGNVGRGGWTWYTGSAAWMYRIMLGNILGIQLEGGKLRFAPCVPRAWRRYEVEYRHGATTFHVVVENPQGLSKGPCRVELDGELVRDGLIDLVDDGRDHQVRVTLLTGDFLLQREPSLSTFTPRPE